jgi:DNA-binding PadR family transcriptional regulator
MHPMHGRDGRPFGPRLHHPRGGRPGFGGEGAPFAPHRGGPHHGGRSRRPRGDVRTAVLLLLTDQPMHGYQLMQAIAERSGGRWTPSPGAIYPTISQLEDEGLVTVTAESGRKLVSLTEAGRAHVEERRVTWSDPFAGTDAAAPGTDLRGLLQQLHEAARQVARTGDDAQLTQAAQVLTEARRSLYLLLADAPQAPGADAPEAPRD